MPAPKKTRASKADITDGVFTGKFSPKNLPHDLYQATAEKLAKGVKDGIRKEEASFKFDVRSEELAKELNENVYMFSAAKTFQQTYEMSEALTDEEGNRRSFKDFKEKANEIYEKYNGEDVEDDNPSGWLRAEYDNAIAQARMADKWDEIEKNKEDFPNLMYVTTGDDRVCDICEPLDNIILPADDPQWDDIYPPNHFGCYCTVIQMDDETTAEKGGVDELADIEGDIKGAKENMNPIFFFNSGKDKEIFKSTGEDKHPYFYVPKEYKELAQRNFDLKIPK